MFVPDLSAVQVEKSGPEGQGRRYPPALPLVSRGLYVVFFG